MSAQTFTIIADPSPRALSKAIKQLGRDVRSWRPAWRAAAPYLARGIAANITGRGGLNGAAWAPLKPGTVRRKMRLGQNRGPLIGTGANILDPFTGGSAVVDMTATRMKVGVANKIANIQHHGSTKRGIPARRFVDWNRPMEAAVMRAMDVHARAMIAKVAARIDSDRRGVR